MELRGGGGRVVFEREMGTKKRCLINDQLGLRSQSEDNYKFHVSSERSVAQKGGTNSPAGGRIRGRGRGGGGLIGEGEGCHVECFIPNCGAVHRSPALRLSGCAMASSCRARQRNDQSTEFSNEQRSEREQQRRIIPCICAAADASTVTPTCSHPNRQKKPGSVALTCPAPAINQSFRTFTPTSLLTGLYPYHPRHLPPPLLGPFQGLVPVYKNAYSPDFQAA